jgi:probable rRNA maturation factor
MRRGATLNGELTLRNQQRDCRIDPRALRTLVRTHLETQLGLASYDIAVHLVSSQRMAAINRKHLQHEGPTDVITFDYRPPHQDELHGELLICPAVALIQAREHRTSWESELARYIIHGILHLQGYDDHSPTTRRVMKREENRRLKALLASQSGRPPGAPRAFLQATA